MRLDRVETDIDTSKTNISNLETRATTLENTKVNKGTTVNGYTLGSTENKDELKTISIRTGDILEGAGLGSNTNLWYTENRVNTNTNVANATSHLSKLEIGREHV